MGELALYQECGTIRVPRRTSRGAFCFMPSDHKRILVGKAPLSCADLRPAVRLGNDGTT